MTDSAVKALIFAAGALVGSAVTYILCSKAAKDRRDELVESYEKEIRELNEAVYADDIPNDTVEASAVADPLKFKLENKTDYTKHFKADAVNGPKISMESYEELVRAGSFPQEEADEPYLVTQDIFEHDPDGYTQFELRYYMDDDYLCDVNDIEEPIMDIDRAVGYKNLEIFRNTDAEYIWVKNDKSKSICEVEVYRSCPCPINTIFDPD